MTNIILIYEECHGLIGIANRYTSALDLLFKNNWVDRAMELRLREKYDKYWLDHLYAKDVKWFNDFCDGAMRMEEYSFYEYLALR